jgi:DNA-directed RNA polymerase specialized sigma24 family protein
LRHGGHLERVGLDPVTVALDDTDETVLAVHEALDRLSAFDPLKAELVKLRYFIGLNHSEIAQVLGLSEPTVRRHWAFARSWLYAALKTQLGSLLLPGGALRGKGPMMKLRP